MSDAVALQQLRESRFFESWDGHVSRPHIDASEAILRRLIDEILALGAEPGEDVCRAAVDACVGRFNDIDDGWICTIEREDIYEQVGRIVDLTGFDCDEVWLYARDW